jgi:4-hydroxybenzoate polyprenyltransferase
LSNFLTIVKATRLYRIIPVLMVMAVSMAFAGEITKEIILLSICCALVYAVIGIHNAIKDKDYCLPRCTNKIMFLLSLAALIVSLFHYILFLTVIAWIILGIVYNTVARFVLFGDTTILAITHFALPSFVSSLLLGLDARFALMLSLLFFIIAWFITQTKNLKDTAKDKKRNYVTLTTKFKKGDIITQGFLIISFALMIVSYFLLYLGVKSIVVLVFVFIIIIIASKKINNNEQTQGLGLLRFGFLIFMFGLILEKTSNVVIIMYGLFLCCCYMFFLLTHHIPFFYHKGWLASERGCKHGIQN